MSSEPSDYASYLLRLVRSERDGHVWRASLESTADGQRLEFGSVAALIGFLEERYGQTEENAPAFDEEVTQEKQHSSSVGKSYSHRTKEGEPEMKEANMRIVRRVFTEVFDKHNLGVVDELFAADFVYHAPGNPDFDREGLKQGFAAYLAAFPDARMTIEDIFAAGDRVSVRYTCRGTHQGEFMGVPPSGKEVTMTAILIHRLGNGKMVEDWEWSDNLGFMAQLGIVKLPQ